MTLKELQTALQITTGTDIEEVILDSDIYFALNRDKSYPYVLWMLDGAEFDKDIRSSTIEDVKIITLACFGITNYNPDSDDKIVIWDTLESQFYEYLNLVNTHASLQVMNIDNLRGTYIWDGERSPDRELGIMFQRVQLKMYC
jgi:hypothetical protein